MKANSNMRFLSLFIVIAIIAIVALFYHNYSSKKESFLSGFRKRIRPHIRHTRRVAGKKFYTFFNKVKVFLKRNGIL